MSAERVGVDIEGLVGERVRGLQEYAPEPLEALAHRLGLPVGQLIKLDANENPYGPTGQVMRVLGGYNHVHRYPDPVSRELRRGIGRWIDVDPGQIVVGNGSDELIDLIMKVFRPGLKGGGIAQIVDCPPTFGMYQFYGVANDMQVISIPRDEAFALQTEAVVDLCRDDPQPRILFVASPNNPDGQLLPEKALQRLLDLPLIVVLDEAYVDFCEGSRVGLVAESDNLIVLRTFSKWAGLAGLRVGYGVFPQAMMTALWRLKSPYNVNGLAQAAAQATLADLDTARQSVAKIVAERERLLAKLKQISFLRVRPSQANFLLCRVEGVGVATIREAMEERGIILRYFGGPGLEDCIRITVGTPMQDESLLMVLRRLDEEKGDGS